MTNTCPLENRKHKVFSIESLHKQTNPGEAQYQDIVLPEPNNISIQYPKSFYFSWQDHIRIFQHHNTITVNPSTRNPNI